MCGPNVRGTTFRGWISDRASASTPKYRGSRTNSASATDSYVDLFTGTLDDHSATDDALWDALDTVEARRARELADGSNTILGRDLDDARIQQVALACVLLTEPPVAVLDEATAHGSSGGSLDAAVRASTAGRTAIIVTRRFTHTTSDDRVIFMTAGRIIEEDSHTQLTAAAGVYAGLWTTWTENRAAR